MTVPEQNSNLYGSGTKNGSGTGPNISMGSGGVGNGHTGTGTGGSGTNAAATRNAGGSCAIPGVAQQTGPSWYKPFGIQQARPNVIKRPPVILRRVTGAQAATAGADKILSCLDRQPQKQSCSQGPPVVPPPCAPSCLSPPPGCCFPPPGCFPPPPRCCFPPPGCFPPPPRCCFPPPRCFPTLPGCCPPPCLGFPTPFGYPRPLGIPLQNQSRFPNSPGLNATGPGPDSPYFNNCNFYITEPSPSGSNSTSSQQCLKCPRPGAPESLMNPCPIPKPQGSCDREEQRVSLLPNCKSGGSNKVRSDSDCAKSLNGNFPSEFMYSNGDTPSDCMSSRNCRRNRHRKGDFCSCKECIDKLIEKEVSKRLKKLSQNSGSYSRNKYSSNETNKQNTSSNPRQYNSGSSTLNSNSLFLSEKSVNSRNSYKNSSTLCTKSATKSHKMLPSDLTSTAVKTSATGSTASDLSSFYSSSERKTTAAKAVGTNNEKSNRSYRSSKTSKSSKSSGSSSTVKSHNSQLSQEIRAAASSIIGNKTKTAVVDVTPKEASVHHSQREPSTSRITVEVKIDEATSTNVVRPSSLRNPSKSAPCLPLKETMDDSISTGVIGPSSQQHTSVSSRSARVDRIHEATSAYGAPSKSVPCIPAVAKTDDATSALQMFPNAVNNDSIVRDAQLALTSDWDKEHTASNNYPHTPQGLNESHSTITRIVVTPSSNSCVRTKHVTVYKQRVHRNDDQAPHVYPTVYHKGVKRKLH